MTDIQILFDNSKRIVFLTGAGISTPSGIPDYRSKNGLYTNDKTSKPAEYYLSHECLVKEPAVFYDYVISNLDYPDAQPNVIHEKQAALTRAARATVVTQNIDNLYEKAHTENLIEFHGNLGRIYCQKCGVKTDLATYRHSMVHENCGGILRPDVVLYGEGINEQVVMDSVTALQKADLIVVVGTSMRVYPFAGLLDYRNPAAQVLVINQEKLNLPEPFIMEQGNAVDIFKKLRV